MGASKGDVFLQVYRFMAQIYVEIIFLQRKKLGMLDSRGFLSLYHS